MVKELIDGNIDDIMQYIAKTYEFDEVLDMACKYSESDVDREIYEYVRKREFALESTRRKTLASIEAQMEMKLLNDCYESTR